MNVGFHVDYRLKNLQVVNYIEYNYTEAQESPYGLSLIHIQNTNIILISHAIPYGAKLFVQDGQEIRKGEML